MGKYVVSKGKTVKEAVTIALELLDVYKNEVDIEIIKNETKGILGLGAQPAVVRVTVIGQGRGEATDSKPKTAAPHEELTLDQALDALLHQGQSAAQDDEAPAASQELSGKIWVKDGRVSCKDSPDKFPMIIPGKNMKVYKNGELIEKTEVIHEKDQISVVLEEEIQEPSGELTLSGDKMEVFLKVKPGLKVTRKLKDASPHHFVELTVEEKKEVLKLKNETVMNELKELGVVHGIHLVEIIKACESELGGTFTIAQGTSPRPGRHGYFRFAEDMEEKKQVVERQDGTIDYRENQVFPSVERGQIIGFVLPPEPGMPGRTVTNEERNPPEVFPLFIRQGKGALLVEGGAKVIAADAGRPEIVQKRQHAVVSVKPILRIDGDVQIKTGNIHYFGDVEIIGSVQDGMLVEAQGHILIRKSVYAAKIISENSIFIEDNMIASEIKAGYGVLLKEELGEMLRDLTALMLQMHAAIEQLSSVSAFKIASFTRTGLGPLIKILCEGKFKTFTARMTAFIQKIQTGTEILEAEWFEFSKQVEEGFPASYVSSLRTLDDFSRLIQAAEQLLSSLQAATEERSCCIQAGNAHNGRLYASGDIMLSGKGSYNTFIYAGGNVSIKGFLRGGEITAAKDIRIGEAGTKGGIPTKISVQSEGMIRINNVLEDTVIQVGAKIYRFDRQAYDVLARLDENGELIIIKGGYHV